jgi:hypothetical protein
MFLASALKRGRHPPENIMKFNVPGGECLSLGHLLRTWPPAISVKTTLRFSHRSETSVCTYSVTQSGGCLVRSTFRRPPPPKKIFRYQKFSPFINENFLKFWKFFLGFSKYTRFFFQIHSYFCKLTFSGPRNYLNLRWFTWISSANLPEFTWNCSYEQSSGGGVTPPPTPPRSLRPWHHMHYVSLKPSDRGGNSPVWFQRPSTVLN